MLQSNQQNHPDKNIGHDPPREVMAVHCDSAVPEQCRQRPGVGPRDGGQVHEGWEPLVAPVGDGLVDEVGDEDDLGAPEVVAGPEEDPGEDEEVVEDEVGCYVCGCGDEGGVLGEEVPDVAELREEEEDPGSYMGVVSFLEGREGRVSTSRYRSG